MTYVIYSYQITHNNAQQYRAIQNNVITDFDDVMILRYCWQIMLSALKLRYK